VVKTDDTTLSAGLGGPYFDPSYGMHYSDSTSFELKAIAGYMIEDPFLFNDTNNNTRYVARTSKGTANTSFDH